MFLSHVPEGSILFFSWPVAGLTNQVPVRHFDPGAPLAHTVLEDP